MDDLEKKYQEVLEESTNNEDIIGLYLGGSRGKSSDFLTEDSDFDVYVVLSDSASNELVKKMNNFASSFFEIRVWKFSEFVNYAAWGSSKDWDRYNFSHNKPIIDKTGEIGNIMEEKGKLPEEFKDKVIKDSLDSYINQVYRSAKYWRDGKELAAYLDATESLPFLMTALYALEGRIKPYNKYFEWELKNFPLELLPWKSEEFINDYLEILRTGKFETQAKIFQGVKNLFIGRGYKGIFEEWKEYYFVGK